MDMEKSEQTDERTSDFQLKEIVSTEVKKPKKRRRRRKRRWTKCQEQETNTTERMISCGSINVREDEHEKESEQVVKIWKRSMEKKKEEEEEEDERLMGPSKQANRSRK